LKSKIINIFHGNCATSSRPKSTKKFLSLTLATTLLMTVMPLTANAATTVNIDGNGTSRPFYGIGMVNSSGTSKLLKDYPANQQSDILDFLFKPKFGASLQVVKNEIGADSNSSSGTEPSHWRNQADTPVARGVNFWIASQAKLRNANMEYAGLRWATPAWVNTDALRSSYLLKYLDLMSVNGTPVDFIGPGINETNYITSLGDFIKNTFKPALDAGGYTSKIVIADDINTKWSAASTINSDAALKADVFAQSAHYTDSSTSTAQSSGMPLFNSESDTGMMDWSRGIWVARRIATALSTGKQSMWMYQPALDSVYENIKYQRKGILTANTPWSGYYEIQKDLWLTAQFTQFADVGWKILDSGSGAVDADNSYVTFKDSASNNYSIVLVNGGSYNATYTFNTTNLSTAALNVWATDQNAQFVQKTSITPSSGSFTITVPAQSVYSLTTTTGQQKGTPTYSIPANSNISLPYTDDFSSYAIGDQAKYFHDQDGAFEVADDGTGGKVLKQVVTNLPTPWGSGNSQKPFSVIGGLNLANYQVSSDVKIPDTSSYASVVARINEVDGMAASNTEPEGYSMRLGGNGSWALRKSTGGTVTTLSSGTITGYNNANWHNVKIAANGTTITGYVDGVLLTTVTDGTFSSGNAAIATDTTSTTTWPAVMYDNFKIEAIDANTLAFVNQIDDADSTTFSYSLGNWTNSVNTSYSDLKRTHSSSSSVGATLNISFNGSQISLVGTKSSSGGTADVYMDGVLQTTINTSTTATQNRNVLYSNYGLAAGSHTFQLVVQSGTITVDYADAQSFNPATALSTVSVNDNDLGTYNNQYLYNAAWSYGSQSGAYAGDNHWSSTTNNYYQVGFNGTQVKVFTAKASNQGIAAISIDGGTETLVDTYASTRSDNALIYTSPELAPGQHTVKVRVTGTKNASSTGNIITADRIDVLTPVTVNDNTTGTGNNQYQYNTTWSYGSQSGAYNNDNHWSSVTNNYYQLSFNGTQAKVFTATASNQGIAAISIDGGTETLVDTYASSRSDDVLIYTSPVLTAGQHTLKVRVTGTKNTSSSGNIITADRIDVIN
jgi:hypothetical protein